MEELNEEEMIGVEGGACWRNGNTEGYRIEKNWSKGDFLQLSIGKNVFSIRIVGAWTQENKDMGVIMQNVTPNGSYKVKTRNGQTVFDVRRGATTLRITRYGFGTMKAHKIGIKYCTVYGSLKQKGEVYKEYWW